MKAERRGEAFAEYVAAGQRCGGPAVFLTLMATMLGASATLGVAEKAEKIGFPAAWWLLAGAAGLALQGWMLSERIRESGAWTLPELAGQVAGPWARRLVAAVIAVSWPGVVGAQFAAAGGVLAALLGVDARWAMAGFAVVVALYTWAGGQRAVVGSDAIEMAVLALGFGGLFGWVFGGRLDGTNVPIEEIRLLGPGFGAREAVLTVLTVGGAYFLGPDIASRSLVARDGRTARRAVLWAAPVLALFGVGIALAGMWAGCNAPGDGNAVLRIAALLPWPLRWSLAGGIVAALLSSADTCLVNAGAIIAHDLGGTESVRAARWAVAAVAAAALGLAMAGGDIIGILLRAYSVYTPGIVCPLAVALVAGRVRQGPWLGAVAAGGACGLAGTLGVASDILPVVGMGLSLALALAAVRGKARVRRGGRGWDGA
ncbi:MAG: sodium:solute symporter, partial [Kiritimatiellae bacterium]|nr:sodium:solute symporter [Kiritimatiellia bacterium]